MNKKETEICLRIYERNKERLNWYMWKYFGTMDREDVHDVLQDTWKILGQNISQVGTWEEARLVVWLTKVCRNRAVSLLRARKNLVNPEEPFRMDLLEVEGSASVEDEVISKLMAEALLSELTKEERSILLKGSTLAPSQTGRPKSNAEICKAYRLRKKLKKLWKEGGWDG